MSCRDVLFEDAPKRLRAAVIIAVLGIGGFALLSVVPSWVVLVVAGAVIVVAGGLNIAKARKAHKADPPGV